MESIQHHDTGMRDVKIQDILQRLTETLLTVTVADIKSEEMKLLDGIPYDIDTGIHVFIGKYKSSFLILETNYFAIPNIKKIEYVQDALKKLRCVEINGFLTEWNRQNGSAASKVFANFERDLINAFQAIGKETLKMAGYTAKVQESKDATIAIMQDQIQTLMAEANAAKIVPLVRDQSKWCCTHHWCNHTSKMCYRPKTDHDKDESKPPTVTTSTNKKRRKG